MNKYSVVIVIFAFSLSLSSCATTGQSGQNNGASSSAKSGAILGAITGAIGGLLATGDAKGAIGGAVIGGVAGYFIGVEIGKAKTRKIKTANQIYKQKPQLAKVEAKNLPPTVSNMTPVIRNQSQKRVYSVKNGEWIDLCTNYQINIPKHSPNRTVAVTEYNTLIAPDNSVMKGAGLKRKIVRECGQIEGAIPVRIPKNMPAGKYKHYAYVIVNGKKYDKMQNVQIAISDGVYEVYAVNSN